MAVTNTQTPNVNTSAASTGSLTSQQQQTIISDVQAAQTAIQAAVNAVVTQANQPQSFGQGLANAAVTTANLLSGNNPLAVQQLQAQDKEQVQALQDSLTAVTSSGNAIISMIQSQSYTSDQGTALANAAAIFNRDATRLIGSCQDVANGLVADSAGSILASSFTTLFSTASTAVATLLADLANALATAFQKAIPLLVSKLNLGGLVVFGVIGYLLWEHFS